MSMRVHRSPFLVRVVVVSFFSRQDNDVHENFKESLAASKMLHQHLSELRRSWPSLSWLVSERETIEARSDINHCFDLHLIRLVLRQWALFRVCLLSTDTFQFVRYGKHTPDIVRRRWTPARQTSNEQWKGNFLLNSLISFPFQNRKQTKAPSASTRTNHNVSFLLKKQTAMCLWLVFNVRAWSASISLSFSFVCLTIELSMDITVRMFKLKNESARCPRLNRCMCVEIKVYTRQRSYFVWSQQEDMCMCGIKVGVSCYSISIDVFLLLSTYLEHSRPRSSRELDQNFDTNNVHYHCWRYSW